MTLPGVLLALHVLGAVAWVGGMAFAILVLRPSVGVIEPVQRLALHAEVFRRFFRLVWHIAPLVFLTGYANVFLIYGGFAGAQWSVHIMHALGLAMAVVFLAVWFGPWAEFRRTRAPDDRLHALGRIRRLIIANLGLGTLTIAIAALGAF
jgi:uncharacterized membrane protein